MLKIGDRFKISSYNKISYVLNITPSGAYVIVMGGYIRTLNKEYAESHIIDGRWKKISRNKEQ